MPGIELASAFVRIRPQFAGFRTDLETQVKADVAEVSRTAGIRPHLDMGHFREQLRVEMAGSSREFLVKPKLDMAGFKEEVRLKTAAAGGEFLVKPKLDMAGFREEVRLKTAAADGEFLVKPKLDMIGFREEVRAKTALSAGEFLVKPKLDMAGFRQEVRAKTAAAGGEFLVRPHLDMAGFREEVRAKTAVAGGEFLVKPKLNMTGFREEVRAKTALAGGEFLVRPKLEMTGFREEVRLKTAAARGEFLVKPKLDMIGFREEVRAKTSTVGSEFLVKPRLDMAGFRERLTAAVMRASLGVEAVIRVTADTAPAKRKVAEVTAETRALGAETGALGRVGAESYSLLGEHAGKFGRYLQVAKLGVLGLGLAFAGAVYEGVKMSADYTREMTKVQALTDSSGENFKKIRVDVLNLSGATARAPKELADALYFIESGGLRGSRAMDALTMTARAAATGLGNTKDVAQLLVGAMNAYSSTGLTAKAATDALVAGVTEGHMPVDELARSLGRVQGVAAALHVSFPQVVANIAAMTKTGMSSSQAATSLQSVITALGRMDAPSKMVAGAMKEVGISSASVRKEMQEKGLNATLNDIANRTQAWSKANHGSNAALLQLFPNVRALRDITGTSIAQQEAYNHVLNRVEHATDGVGRANEAFAITQRTLPFRIREVTNAIRVDLIKFGDAMAPVINRIFDWAASVGPGVTRFFRNLKEGFQAFLPILGPFVTAFLTPLVAGFTLAAKGAGLFAAALAPVGRWLSQYRGWFEPILVMAGTYVGVMTGWIVVTKAWAVATDIAKAAQLAFNTVVKANPIMMVVAAIAALAVGIKYAYDHFKPFHDAWDRGWKQISGVIVALGPVWDHIVGAFEHGWKQISDAAGALVPVWHQAVGAFEHGGRQISDAWHQVASAFQHGWHQITGFATRMWNDVSSSFEHGWHQVTGFATRMWGDVSAAFDHGWRQVTNFVSRLWNDVSSAFAHGWHQIADLVSRLWRDVSDAFTRGWHQISDLVTRLWHDVVALFTRLWADVTNMVTRLWHDIAGFFTNIWRDVTNMVTRLWHDVTGFFTNLWRDVTDIVTRLWHDLSGSFTNLWHDATRIVTGLWHDVSSFFGRMRDDVVGIFDDLVTKVGHVWDRVKEIVAGPIRWVIDNPYDKGIVPLIHGIGDILHEPGMQNLAPLHFAGGGKIPGNHNRDTVPFYGTPGEVVVPKPVVARFGGPDMLMDALGFTGGGGPHHYAVGGPLVPAGFNLSGANLSGLSGLSNTLSNVAHAAPGVAAARQFVTAADAKRIASTSAGGGGVLDTIGRGISRLGHDIVHPTDLLADLKKLALGALATVAAPAIHGLESAADGALKGMGEPGRWMGKEVHNIGDALLALIQGKDDAYNAAQAAAAAAAAGGGGGGFIGQVGNGTDIVNQARKYLGQQYVLGGNPYGTAGTDCSGLVDRVMADLGHRLPGRPLTWDLVKMGQPINYKDALPGDLVFTNYGEGGIPGPGHVGIYEGGGRMIDDPNPSSHVREENVWETPGAVRRLLVDHLPTVSAAAVVNGNWADVVYQALKMENLPASAAGGVLRLIQSESGGDANAQNNWDSNARAGTPSQGLMQLIPGTFAANHWPGTSDNIRDPLANIAAGINYAVKTYGVGMLMGGGRHDGSGRYVGYDTGGLLHPGVTQVVNASGKPEAVLTNAQWQALATLASHLRQMLAGHTSHHHPHHRVRVPDLHDPRRLHHPHHRVRLHHPLHRVRLHHPVHPVHLHHPHRPVHLHHPLHPVRLHHTVHHAAQHLAHHVGHVAHHVAHRLHHPHHRVHLHHPVHRVHLHHPVHPVRLHHPRRVHLHHPVHRVRLHHPHHPIRLHHPTHKVHLHHPLHPVRLHHPHHPVRLHHPHHRVWLHHPVAPPVHHHLHHAAHHPHHPLHHLVHPHHTSHHSTHHAGHHTSHRTPHQQAVGQFMQTMTATTTQLAGNLATFIQSEQAFRDTLRGTITKGSTVNDFLPHSGNAGDLRQFMSDKLASIRNFTSRIAQLRARGWPDAIIRDIAGDGLEFGVQYADMLLTSSRSDQSAIVKLSSAIDSQGLASANYLTQLTSGHPGVKLPGFADGGRYPMGRAFRIGERGPETLLLDHPGTIVPNGGAVLNRSQWAGVKRLAVGADRAGLPAAMHLPATSPEARHGADLHSVVEALHRLADAGGHHGPVQHVEHQHISSGLDLEAELRKSEFRMLAGGF